MRKVLKWGVVPLNLEGHGMNPHSFSWASTNSPVNIRDFNHTLVARGKLITFHRPASHARTVATLGLILRVSLIPLR